jgi:hypothetical protein
MGRILGKNKSRHNLCVYIHKKTLYSTHKNLKPENVHVDIAHPIFSRWKLPSNGFIVSGKDRQMQE